MKRISIADWIYEKIRSAIAIVQDGDTATRTIASGKYVIWKGVLCKAKTAIPSGTTLSSTNLKAVSDGGLNELHSDVETLNSKITPEAYSSMATTVASITQYTKCYKFGKLFVGGFTLITSQAIDAHDAILTNLPIPKDGCIPNFAACTDGSSNEYPLYIDSTGTLRCRLNLLASMALYFSVSYVVS